MSKVPEGVFELALVDGTDVYTRATMWDASPESVFTVLGADPTDPDGRSQWVWITFPNGDRMLGTFPQGDTYFAVETDQPQHFRPRPGLGGEFVSLQPKN